jgi:hypothetical protein
MAFDGSGNGWRQGSGVAMVANNDINNRHYNQQTMRANNY